MTKRPVVSLLAPLPFGLLITAALVDLIYLSTGAVLLTHASFAALVVGVALGGAAAVVKLLRALPEKDRASEEELHHALEDLALVLLFAASAWLRRGQLHREPTAVALCLELVALIAGTAAACLGSELAALREARRAAGAESQEHQAPAQPSPLPLPPLPVGVGVKLLPALFEVPAATTLSMAQTLRIASSSHSKRRQSPRQVVTKGHNASTVPMEVPLVKSA